MGVWGRVPVDSVEVDLGKVRLLAVGCKSSLFNNLRTRIKTMTYPVGSLKMIKIHKYIFLERKMVDVGGLI